MAFALVKGEEEIDGASDIERRATPCWLVHLAEPKVPALNPDCRKDPGLRPRVGCELPFNRVPALRTEDQKHVFAAFEGSGKTCEPPSLQHIHKCAMRLPICLFLQRRPWIVRSAVTTDDHEKTLTHGNLPAGLRRRGMSEFTDRAKDRSRTHS